MYWVLLAVVAGLSSNFSNVFSRYLLKDGEDIAVYSWFYEFSRFIVFGLIAFFDFYLKISFWNLMLLITIGLFEYISNYVYMKMHAYTHLSISAVVSRTRFIWVPIIAFIFLGEHLKLSVYIGIMILFLGLAIAKSPHKLFFDKGLRYAYTSAFLIAITIVMMSAATKITSPSLLLVFLSFPTSTLTPFLIKQPIKRLRSFFKKNVLLKCIAAIFNVAAVYLFTLALKTGPVSIVSAIYNGALIIAVLAGIIFLNEREDMWRKLLGTAVATIGIIFLTSL